MALSRCIETRLLEAVWTETKNCFNQVSLGLQSLYFPNSVAQIHARPWRKGETINPYTIYIVPVAPQWRPGVGGVANDFFIIEVTFVFPFDLLDITAGATSHIDHIEALRRWIVAGGSWLNRAMGIQDPDNLGHEVAHLTAFTQSDIEVAPGNAGIGVPVLLEFETRSDKSGAIA